MVVNFSCLQHFSKIMFYSSVFNIIISVLFITSTINAEFADFGTVPKGVNPTLYDAADDPIVQLDESTFNDTVFCSGRGDCPSYLVEFYSDWCGHCRSYASLYKSFAKDIRGWSKVIKIAAMNCADPVNEATCRANGIMFFPYIKYFPRNSSDTFYGVKLRPYQSVAEMRDQITQVLIQDYAINHFEDWPTFDVLGDISTYGELWHGAKESADTMAIVFENDPSSLIGAQLLLDLTKYSDRLLARRCLKTHPLVDALHITDFPTLAVFRRGERTPVLIAELRRLLLNELEEFLHNERENNDVVFNSRKNMTNICTENPEKCKSLFFVSETDMLKAMRYSLLREVPRHGGYLSGANLTALYSFVDILAQSFPTTTMDSLNNDTEVILGSSARARVVFTHLRDFLDAHGLEEPLAVDDWQSEFSRAEEDQGNPFPISGDWEHCKGSTPSFRGYTCGLWTTFHALTVSAYKNGINDVSKNFRPLPVLQAIRDFVGSFFGCEHCRKHFIKMTTRSFKMEAQVRKAEDIFLYLWRAHNIVNARLKGRDTEDPRFPKYQFPAMFLCPNCHSTKSRMNEKEVQSYLIDYYSRIRPIKSSAAAATENSTSTTLVL
uniref:Sulfhydryl oxidase n=1 Tax=Panagrolaimus sp. PS1159 TaxID=55785 RepID=A0AC35G3C9_9BILA